VAEEGDVLDAYSRVVVGASERLLPSVAHLRSNRGSGSAVVLSSDGFLITSAHVDEGTRRVAATFVDGSEYRAEVIGSDPLSDLAVLRADGDNLVPVELGDASELRVGQLVVAVGNPRGLEAAVSAGVRAAPPRARPAPPAR